MRQILRSLVMVAVVCGPASVADAGLFDIFRGCKIFKHGCGCKDSCCESDCCDPCETSCCPPAPTCCGAGSCCDSPCGMPAGCAVPYGYGGGAGMYQAYTPTMVAPAVQPYQGYAAPAPAMNTYAQPAAPYSTASPTYTPTAPTYSGAVDPYAGGTAAPYGATPPPPAAGYDAPATTPGVLSPGVDSQPLDGSDSTYDSDSGTDTPSAPDGSTAGTSVFRRSQLTHVSNRPRQAVNAPRPLPRIATPRYAAPSRYQQAPRAVPVY